MNAIKIPNKSIIADFKEHLDLDLNRRILFTAPFGAGKSTFINEFQEEHNKEYRFIRLYPVNYAVSANEDVFELIKFDILYELMAHYQAEINLQKEDFDFWLRMSMFMQNKADLMPLFLFVLSQHEKIGKSAAVFIGAFEKILKPLNKGFKEYSDQIKIDELADISTFLESFENKKGNQYEMDATSQFIYDLVDRLKGDELPNQEVVNDEDKKRENQTVLVIDDLDRLDPDHIFRLFNIFSAHTHAINGENKFGFDKVIFVCDIENIQRIYTHKYGAGVDFSGYMDKFYSLKPFEFDHKEHLTNQLRGITQSYDFKLTDEEFVKGTYFNDLLVGLLKIFIKERIVNLRSLLQVTDSTFYLEGNKNSNFQGIVLPGIILLKIIKEMVGGISVLEESLKSMIEDQQNIFNVIPPSGFGQSYKHKFSLTKREYDLLVETFIVFQDGIMLDINKHSYTRDQKKYYLKKLNATVFYMDDSYNYTKKINVSDIHEGNCIDEEDKSNINKLELSIPNLMLHAFNYLKDNHEL